jgi:threonine dehydrogenase-like Zn-dependent dehydrogenase
MMNAAARVMDAALGKRSVAEGTSSNPAVEQDEMMKAVVWNGAEKVSVEMVPKPAITHPKDVIVKVTACTICSGSDTHLYAGLITPTKPGSIMGHEAMGIIESKGDEVKNFQVGDRVVIAFDIACGECDMCQRKEFSACRVTNDSRMAERFFGHAPGAIFGYSAMLGDVDGSQAEYVRVPLADSTCFAIPDDVPDEKALYMSDVLCTSLHAVEMAEVKEGDTIVIWGLGPIGLCTARWCQIRGAKRVIAVESVPERIRLARHALGIDVLDRANKTSDQVCESLLELVPDGADATIECAGFRYDQSLFHKMQRTLALETDTPEILQECFKITRPYGRVSVIADYIGTSNQFPIGMIMMKHLTVLSGQCPCQKYFPYVLEKLRDGTFDPSFMITHRITLDQVPDAYGHLYRQEDGWIKVFIRVAEDKENVRRNEQEGERGAQARV